MKIFPQAIVLLVVLSLSGQTTGEENTAGGPTAGVRKVVVEGVAAASQAAPIAAMREIGARILGRPFSVLHGKYVALGEELIPVPLDTKKKQILSIENLRTGLFRAVIEVETPGEEAEEEKLRERNHPGAGDLRTVWNLLLARELAREDAMEKAILSAVAEQYPGDSAPARLAGWVFFLGTIREEIEGKEYTILARIKVRLVEP